jgi:hypothetical protein
VSIAIRGPLRFLAEVRRRAGHPAEAVSLLRRVRAIEMELFGTAVHRDVAETDRRLGSALTEMATPEARAEARRHLDHALAVDRQLRPGQPELGECLAASARLRLDAGGDPALARSELEEAAGLFASTVAKDDPRRRQVASLLVALGRHPGRSP